MTVAKHHQRNWTTHADTVHARPQSKKKKRPKRKKLMRIMVHLLYIG